MQNLNQTDPQMASHRMMKTISSLTPDPPKKSIIIKSSKRR